MPRLKVLFSMCATILVLISMCTCNGGIWVLFCSRFGNQISTREETSLEDLGVWMHDSTGSHLNSMVVREGVHGLVTGGVTPCEVPSSFYSLTLHQYYAFLLQLQVGLFYLFIYLLLFLHNWLKLYILRIFPNVLSKLMSTWSYCFRFKSSTIKIPLWYL